PQRLRAGAAARRGDAMTVLAFVLLAAAQPDLAIEHARIHTGDGHKIDDGTLVVRGETILAVGASAEVRVPDGARRVDGRGLWVTPGLVDAEALTGTVEVTQEDSTDDSGLDGRYDAIRAAFSVLDGLNPRSVLIPVTRIEGVTTSVLVPRGGLVSGRQAVVRLAGDSAEAMVVRSPAAIYATASGPGRAAAFGARGGVMLRLRELFDDVRQYARRRQDFERNQMRKVGASRLDLEALIPVVEGKLPFVVEAHRASDLQAVLRFAREQKIRLVISGASSRRWGRGWTTRPCWRAPGCRSPSRRASTTGRSAGPCASRPATPSPTGCPGRRRWRRSPAPPPRSSTWAPSWGPWLRADRRTWWSGRVTPSSHCPDPA